MREVVDLIETWYHTWWDQDDLNNMTYNRLWRIARAMSDRALGPDECAMYTRWGRHTWHTHDVRKSWESDVDFLWHQRVGNKYLCHYLVPLKNLELLVAGDEENMYRPGDTEEALATIAEAES